MVIPEQLIERFNAKWKADPKTGCWMWAASTSSRGYGQIKLPRQRKQIPAHRLSYLIHRGEVPGGIQVCHRCDTPRCVNPEHLFLGTCADNMKDKVSKGRQDRGESHGGAKLTEAGALEIIGLLKQGLSQSVIAKRYGVGQMEISRIKRGERWGHLQETPMPSEPVTRPPLSESKIRQVKVLLREGVQGVAVAKAFGVSANTISRIKRGKRWASV